MDIYSKGQNDQTGGGNKDKDKDDFSWAIPIQMGSKFNEIESTTKFQNKMSWNRSLATDAYSRILQEQFHLQRARQSIRYKSVCLNGGNVSE